MTLSNFQLGLERYGVVKYLTHPKIQKRNFYSKIRVLPLPNNWAIFPGRGFAKDTCNQFYKYQCECGKKVKVKHYDCNRLECPVCYQKAINRLSIRESKRLKRIYLAGKKQGIRLKFYHFAFNIQDTIKNKDDYVRVRRKLTKILKKENMSGMLVPHLWRISKKTKRAYISSHFHFIGIGNPIKSTDFYNKYGFTYKRLINPHDKSTYRIKSRKELFNVIRYVLSHHSVIKGSHSVTWIGAFSYNQVKKINYQVDKIYSTCNTCGSSLKLCEGFLKYNSGFVIGKMRFIDDPNQKPLSLERYKEIHQHLKLPYEYYRKKETYELEFKNIERIKNSMECSYVVK